MSTKTFCDGCGEEIFERYIPKKTWTKGSKTFRVIFSVKKQMEQGGGEIYQPADFDKECFDKLGYDTDE